VDVIDGRLLRMHGRQGVHAQSLDNFRKSRDLDRGMLLNKIEIAVDVDPVVGNHVVGGGDVEVGDGSGVEGVVDVAVINGLVGVVEEGVEGRRTIGLVDKVVTLRGRLWGYVSGDCVTGSLAVSDGIGPDSGVLILPYMWLVDVSRRKSPSHGHISMEG